MKKNISLLIIVLALLSLNAQAGRYGKFLRSNHDGFINKLFKSQKTEISKERKDKYEDESGGYSTLDSYNNEYDDEYSYGNDYDYYFDKE